jgi:hypothetical protein
MFDWTIIPPPKKNPSLIAKQREYNKSLFSKSRHPSECPVSDTKMCAKSFIGLLSKLLVSTHIKMGRFGKK